MIKWPQRLIPCMLLFPVLFLVSLSLAQPSPDTLWTRTFGGEDADDANDIQQTSDGGYIIAGKTFSFGLGAYLVRMNNVGDTLWTRVFDSANGIVNIFDARAITQAPDGGYVFTGGCMTATPAGAPYLAKIDSLGGILWVKGFEGIYGHSDRGQAVWPTSDGGYVIAADGGAGYFPDIALIKTNGLGDTLWTRAYGLGSMDMACGVQETEDGGYILAGSTDPPENGTLDFYLVKTDENGDALWERTYGADNIDEWGYGLDQTNDGGYIMAGWFNREFGYDDMYVVKTDAWGDTAWTKILGGADNEAAYGVEQTNDGGYIVCGLTHSYGAGGADYYLVKLDERGDTLWTRTYGGVYADFGLSVSQTSDGGYVMAGWTLSFGAGGWDIYVVKTGPDLVAAPKPHPLPRVIALYQNYPNPFNACTRMAFDLPAVGPVTLKVYDLLGREVATLVDGLNAPGYHSILFDGSNLPSGIYFYRIETGNLHEARKMVLLK